MQMPGLRRRPDFHLESPDTGVSLWTTPLNQLLHESSPYLQQHASNPVDWQPWGELAFAQARKENKPVFLSIGYSTCHWCHVMARESFSDPEIAAVMNECFVNVKVDREERPDVDQVYMAFVQATTGSGGWPMNVWLTPDLKPIFGGTYFPPADAMGRPGFKRVLEQLASAWKNDDPGLRAHAGQMTDQLRDLNTGGGNPTDELPSADVILTAFARISSSYDTTYGGFGHAPKFPRPVVFNFLHHFARMHGSHSKTGAKALAMSAETLRKMADGGIHDHLGGGFHRYSVDRFWHIPHYEKMLYDQAQLVTACLDAAALTGDGSFHETARDILGYVTRRMTRQGGGYFSAEDADSLKSPDADHKTEGAFYVWSQGEIDRLLGDKAPLFNHVFGVKPDGNAPEGSDPHGDLAGTNTLIRRHSDAQAAAKFGLTPDAVAQDLKCARNLLFEARNRRPHPHLDDKILTAWNGLMISAFARASRDLGDPAYLTSAAGAADFIRTRLFDAERGVLLRSYRDGPSGIEGFTADYAFLIQGLLDLYRADFDIRWLQWADALQTRQDELFWDVKAGGYFASSGRDPSILMRSKESYDGAEPSENSISVLNLLRLASMLDQAERRDKAIRTLRAFASQIERASPSVPVMLVALERARCKPAQIVIAGNPGAADTQVMLDIARGRALPHQVVLLADGGPGQEYLAAHAAFYRFLTPIDGKATAYVCENFVCQRPSNDPVEFERTYDPCIPKTRV